MSTLPPLNSIDSPPTLTWGELIDTNRRTSANGVSISPADQVLIARRVSAFAWNAAAWPFVLQTTKTGQISCQNMIQDYPTPNNCFRVTRAWFDVPTANIGTLDGTDNTVPPVDDPSYAAYSAALASANYVNSQTGGGTPRALQWPGDGGLTIVKRLDENLIPYSYASIRSCSQLPNANLLRLWGATAVPESQPFSLELEYQPNAPAITDLGQKVWFPDSHIAIAEEGIIYWLYRMMGDPRAGTATTQGGETSYTGQLAIWHAAIQSAVSAERSGAIDTFSPAADATLGSSGYTWGWGWFG